MLDDVANLGCRGGGVSGVVCARGERCLGSTTLGFVGLLGGLLLALSPLLLPHHREEDRLRPAG